MFSPYHSSVAAEIDNHQIQHFQTFYYPILLSLCELKAQFSVLSLREWHSMWSSAAVAHLPQGSTYMRSEMPFCILKIWKKLLSSDAYYWSTFVFENTFVYMPELVLRLLSIYVWECMGLYPHLHHDSLPQITTVHSRIDLQAANTCDCYSCVSWLRCCLVPP